MPTVTPVSTSRIQTCPHGLPHGACPICNGMGGGAKKPAPKPEPPKNQMSFAACYAVWLRMQAADKHQLEAKEFAQKQAEFLQNAQKTFSEMAQKLTVVLNKIENILPESLKPVFNLAVNNIIKPILNVIQNFPKVIENVGKFLQNMQREAYIVAEKLASVFGEIKNFVNKQISETFKKFTKKVYKILNIFGLKEEEDFEEDERINSEIAIFKAKDVVSIKEFLISLAKGKPVKDDDDIIQQQ